MLDYVHVANFRIIRLRCSRSAAAYIRQTFPWMVCRSVMGGLDQYGHEFFLRVIFATIRKSAGLKGLNMLLLCH